MKKLTLFLISLGALAACAEVELGPTIAVPEDQGEGSTIDAPGVRIIDVRTDGFTANWRMVTDALEYEYVFDEDEPAVTRDTVLIFTGLEVDTEHILKIKANPRVESGRLPSPYVSVNVVTNEITTLDAPNLTAGSTYSSISVISWSVVPLADRYEWELSNGESGTTTKTFVTFSGLLEGRGYTLKVRSIPADEVSYNISDWAEISFTPVNDGSATLLSSSFSATSDAISFNVFASSGQYYWYDVIPLLEYNSYESEEAYLEALKAEVKALADEQVAAGKDEQEAWSAVLKSGSANIVCPAYASLSYSIALVGFDLGGNVTTELLRKELTTPADLDSDGPEYKSEGDWFSQTVMLGTSDPTSYVYFKRIGTDVVSLRYLLYTTVKFVKSYGEEMTQDVVNQLISKCEESGSEASETALEKINSSAGYTAGYSGRLAGTSYTVIALATNSAGEQILAVNSITTRSTTAENNWISYALTSKGSDTFNLKVKILEGQDAVAGSYYIAPYSEVSGTWARSQYGTLLEQSGTAMDADQISSLCENGYCLLSPTGLTAETQYIIIASVTNSLGDTTWRHTTTTTKSN